ncbi:hypothetical protein LBWT_X4620 (plasmid) [Leptolyngbya boryana IAM M-101]|nr:hypothetical protein LBWT_X4620 [Leptolyngbya boryana IAM M-101]BAS66738.1 hypothetical protein LBDG_X4620 [Leptolyngbya boryana dg5]
MSSHYFCHLSKIHFEPICQSLPQILMLTASSLQIQEN